MSTYYDTTYKWLCVEFPDFHGMTMDAKSTCIAGKPQAGKSDFTFGVALMCRLRGLVPVMILRNFTKDAVQMKRKFDRFIGRYDEYMKSQGWEECGMRAVGVDNIQEGDRDLVLALYNGYQLSRVKDVYNDVDYALLVDEADAVGYGEIKDDDNRPKYHAASEYNILLDGAHQTWEISATVWDILYGNELLTTNNIVVVRPPGSYKGIRDGVQFVPLEHKVGKWARGVDILEADPNMENIYTRLSVVGSFSPVRYNCPVEHPVIVLHKSYVWQHHHDVFMRMFREHPILGINWTVIVEDSRSCQLYSNILSGHDIRVDGEIVSDEKNNGVFVFTRNGVDIQVLLQYLLDNGGAERFPHIVIKTGQQAGRSRSYVSCDGSWHLTHEYLVPAKAGRNVADLIQSVRLCHNRPDSVPLVLYAPEVVCGELQKADLLQDEQLHRLRELGDPDITVSDHIQTDVWTAGKVPRYRLCRSKRHKRFKLRKVSDDGGWGTTDVTLLYTILDQDKFTKGTVVYEMLGDVESLILDGGLLGRDVEWRWLNKELKKLPRWDGRSLDNIHGALWTSVRKHKGLISVDKKRDNTMVMWKDGSKGYVCMK